MPEEKLTTNQTIEKLVTILNNPENKKIIRANQEFSKYVNEGYESEQDRLYQENRNIEIC